MGTSWVPEPVASVCTVPIFVSSMRTSTQVFGVRCVNETSSRESSRTELPEGKETVGLSQGPTTGPVGCAGAPSRTVTEVTRTRPSDSFTVIGKVPVWLQVCETRRSYSPPAVSRPRRC